MKRKLLPWREHLTPPERKIIEEGDRLRLRLQEVNRDRPRIVNRAIQRAKAAQK